MEKIEYPKFLYHAEKEPIKVMDKAAHEALGPGWVESPVETKSPEAPKETKEPKKSSGILDKIEETVREIATEIAEDISKEAPKRRGRPPKAKEGETA